VADLQVALKEEQVIVEEKKAATDALIVSIGKEKATADEAVEASREDEEAAARLQVGASCARVGLKEQRRREWGGVLSAPPTPTLTLLTPLTPLTPLTALPAGRSDQLPGRMLKGPGCRRAHHC
jgi:hypothetical protein